MLFILKSIIFFFKGHLEDSVLKVRTQHFQCGLTMLSTCCAARSHLMEAEKETRKLAGLGSTTTAVPATPKFAYFIPQISLPPSSPPCRTQTAPWLQPRALITDSKRFLEKLFAEHKTCAGLRKGLDSSSNKKPGYSNIPRAPRATSSQAAAAGRWRSLPQPERLEIQTPLGTASRGDPLRPPKFAAVSSGGRGDGG